MTIYQGDQYNIPITVSRNGTQQGTTNVEKLEVILAGNRKEYPGEITVHGNEFCYPLTQEETMKLDEDSYDLSVRVLFRDQTVEGWLSAGSVNVRAIEGAETL